MKPIHVMTAILVGALAFLTLPGGTSVVSASAFTELQYWHAGDQHVHSHWSKWDASYPFWEDAPTVTEQAQAAADKGLSWIIMTDHHTMMTAYDWSQEAVACQVAQGSTGIKVMLGLEVGSCNPAPPGFPLYGSMGHYLAYGINSYVNPINDCQTMINAVNQVGGFGFIAHPIEVLGTFDHGWHDWDVTGYAGLEIMHAGTVMDQVITKWHEILKDDPSARVYGIGNSDAHFPGEVGNTVTYKYGSVTPYDVYYALKKGKTVFSNGPLITFKMGGVGIGGSIATTSDQTLDIAWDAQRLQGQQWGYIKKIEVYTNESTYDWFWCHYHPVKTIYPSQTETGSYNTYTLDVTAQTHYVRLKGIFSNGEAYTNPIWINYTSGGGCPYLQVWDGSDYVNEGLLDIHNAEAVDVTHEHTVMTVPEPVNGAYQFRLIEHPETTSDVDQVQLRAVLEDGTVEEFPLISAQHSEDGNVLNLLLKSDDRRVEEKGADHNGGVSQRIDLKFAALGPHREPVAFIFTIEGSNYFLKT